VPPALFLLVKVLLDKMDKKIKTTGKKINVGQRFDKNGRRLVYTAVSVASVDGFAVGDCLKVSGTSKGRGFTGVVKRWGFAGGPATHGQSDRQRAPGSIGQGTTPGRVHKGKKMAGRSGNQTITLKNLALLDIDEKNKQFLIKGLLPGAVKGTLIIVNDGKTKNFVSLLKSDDKLVFSPDAQPQVSQDEEEAGGSQPVQEAKEVKEEGKNDN